MTDLTSVLTTLQQGVNAINNLANVLGESAPSTLSANSVNISTIGDNTVIAAASGVAITVYKMFLVTAGSTLSPLPTLSIQGGTTPLTGPMTLPALAGSNAIPPLNYDEKPWLTCPTNTPLVFTLSAAVQLSGRIFFTQK